MNSGIVVIDKPKDCTSHDVVLACRRIFKTRDIGHSGTLDPMATGILILALGEATKLVPWLMASSKSYSAVVQLGIETNTLDAQGQQVGTCPVPTLSSAEVSRAAQSFLGTQEQVVPAVSAIKVGGQRLHTLSRSGGLPEELPSRPVRLDSVDAELKSPTEIAVSLQCGKGFYVRSFARDLAVSLGTVGHLTALRRTVLGAFSERDAARMEIVSIKERAGHASPILEFVESPPAVIPLSGAVSGLMPRIDVDDATALAIRHGKSIALGDPDLLGRTECAAFRDGALLAVLESDGSGWRVRRGFSAAQASPVTPRD